jgi:hypothetical protein
MAATATTATTDLDVDTEIALALHRAGMLNAGSTPEPEQLALGKLFLHSVLTSLQSKGMIVRTVERTELSTVPGQNYVDAPADTVSIEKDGVVRNVDGLTELPIEIYSRSDYMRRIVNKTIQGKPIYYYPEKRADGTFRIYLWQVPTSDWPTIIVPRERRTKDVTVGSVLLDVDVRWTLPVGLALAAEFARHYGRVARQQALKLEYDTEMGSAMDNETERGDAQLCADPSPWDY